MNTSSKRVGFLRVVMVVAMVLGYGFSASAFAPGERNARFVPSGSYPAAEALVANVLGGSGGNQAKTSAADGLEMAAKVLGEQAKVSWNATLGTPHAVWNLKLDLGAANPAEAAKAYLYDVYSQMAPGVDPDRVQVVNASTDALGCAHLHLSAVIDGLPVVGSSLTVHVDPGGKVIGSAGDLVTDLRVINDPGWPPVLDAARARGRVMEKVGIRTMLGGHQAREVILVRSITKRVASRAWEVAISAWDPVGQWRAYVDPWTGEIISLRDEHCYVTGQGTVYNPNRISGPLEQVSIDFLDGTGKMRGEVFNIIDETGERPVSDNLTFDFAADSQFFHHASIGYYLAQTHSFLTGVGFSHNRGTIPVVANAQDPQRGGPFNNAFYTPMGRGFIFGNGDGQSTAHLSSDGDVASHEYGHFFHNMLKQHEPTQLHTPIRAMGEAFGDIVQAVVWGDPLVGESTIPGQPYMRNMENVLVQPGDLRGEEHDDGELIGGALWDTVELLSGGLGAQVTLQARQEMARILIAGIPFLPAANVRWTDLYVALDQGDQQRGGANRTILTQAFQRHGLVPGGTVIPGIGKRAPMEDALVQKALAPQGPVVEGYELVSGVPISIALPETFDADDPSFGLFYIRVPQGATQLDVITQGGTGDVVLLVFPLNADLDNTNDYILVDNGFADEFIQVTSSTLPPIERDTTWMIAVIDFTDQQDSLVLVQATVTGGDVSVTPIQFGQTLAGEVSQPGEVDFFVFEGTQNQTISVSVISTDNRLDPVTAIITADGGFVAEDDDSGAGSNALIQNAVLPQTGIYLIAVTSYVSDVGAQTAGPYEVTLLSGAPIGVPQDTPRPTPTANPAAPVPTPDQEGVITLLTGQSAHGTVRGAQQQGDAPLGDRQYAIDVPADALELAVMVDGGLGASMVAAIRAGAPVTGNALDDFSIGNNRHFFLITPTSQNPTLAEGRYYVRVANFSPTALTYTITVSVETASGAPQATPSPTVVAVNTTTPSPTPFNAPTATPTGPPPDGPAALRAFEFDEADIAQTGFVDVPGGFLQLDPGTLTLGSVPTDNAYEGATNGKGLIFTLQANQVHAILGPPIESGNIVLIRASVRSSGGKAALTIGGLPAVDGAPDASNGLQTLASSAPFEGVWKRLVTVVQVATPANQVFPLFQAAAPADGGTTVIYVDRLEVFSVESADQIPGAFFGADGAAP